MKQSGFKDPHTEVDKLIREREEKTTSKEILGKSEQLEKTYDNFVFRNKYRRKPIMDSKSYNVFGVETVDLGPFLELRMWPRSVYVTDKLLRLVAGSKLEFLKRYMAKKRSVPMNMIYILILLFGVAIVIVVIMLIVIPQLGL